MVIVIEEVQRPIGTRPYELAPHRLKFGDGGLDDFRCGVKGNVVPTSGTLNGRGNEDNPNASQSDECFAMTLIVLALNLSGPEKVMKQRSAAGVSIATVWVLFSPLRVLRDQPTRE